MHQHGGLLVTYSPSFLECQNGSAEQEATLWFHFSDQQCFNSMQEIVAAVRSKLQGWGYTVDPHITLYTRSIGLMPPNSLLGIKFVATNRQVGLTDLQVAGLRDEHKPSFTFRGTATAHPIYKDGEVVNHRITVRRIGNPGSASAVRIKDLVDAHKYPGRNVVYSFIPGEGAGGGKPAPSQQEVYDKTSAVLGSMSALLSKEIEFVI